MEMKQQEQLERFFLQEINLPAERIDIPKLKKLLDCLDPSPLTQSELDELDRLRDNTMQTIYCGSMHGKGDNDID